MDDWFRLARQPGIVRRALTTAAMVGTVLIAINHGDALLSGEPLTTGRLCKMALTYLVPYLVSTFAAVAAIRDQARATPDDAVTVADGEPSSRSPR